MVKSVWVGDAGSAKADPNRQALVQWASGSLPSHSKKVQVHKYATHLLQAHIHFATPASCICPGHPIIRLDQRTKLADAWPCTILMFCWLKLSYVTCVASLAGALVCLGRNACRLSNDFREATRVVSQALPSSIPAGHVLLRLAFAGVNASDVNFSSGRYHASVEQAQASLPFDAGFEAVGAVAAVGPQVSGTSQAPLPQSCLLAFSFWHHALQTQIPCKTSLLTKRCLPASTPCCMLSK